MINVKINGKPHEIPESYEELTFGQWCSIIAARSAKDYDEIISIFTGIPKDELKGAKIQGLEILLRKVAFLQKEPVIDETPKKLGNYEFPKDISYETTEQYQDTLSEINRVTSLNDIGEANKALALYAAIYCQIPYDSDRAKTLAKSFMEYPCLEVVAAGSFFMAKCQSLQSGLSMNYLRRNILLKKKKPVLSRFLRRLGFTLRLIRSRAMLEKMTKQS